MKHIPSNTFLYLLCGMFLAGGLLAGCKRLETVRSSGVTTLPPNSASDRAKKGPGSSPPLSEEVWVIACSSLADAESSSNPREGTLLAVTGPTKTKVPLKSTHVHARIAAYIASVEVAQRFQNPYSTNIDAMYVFPLPQNGAVNDFIMSIGPRHIRGIIRERSEAARIYAEAKRQGYTASLLAEQSPGIFSQTVANIEPGKPIEVQITYFHTLGSNDGWWEFVFPMSSDENAHPEFSLTLGINAGLPIKAYECKTHPIKASSPSSQTLEISVARTARLASKEFVFRYQVAGGPSEPEVAQGIGSNHPALAAIWARGKMDQLLNDSNQTEDNARLEEIRRLALDYNLLSPATAFLSVDSTKENPQPNEPNEK